MTNFEKLKQKTPADFARFIMDGTEHEDFFVFDEGSNEGDWYTFQDFLKRLESEAAEQKEAKQ